MLEEAIISELREITGLQVDYIFTTSLPGITYNITPQSGGTVKQDQLEIKIIHTNRDEALKIKLKILDRLDIDDNKPSIRKCGVVFRSALAGGGCIYDDEIQAYELTLIFIIKNWRRI